MDNIVKYPSGADRYVGKEHVVGTTTKVWDGEKWINKTLGNHETRVTNLESGVENLNASTQSTDDALSFEVAKTKSHINNTNNPHKVTKSQVGLDKVDNVSAAALRDRSSHTGTQLLNTISDAGSSASLDAGTADGVATLDFNGKVPLNQINDTILGQVEYKGLWNPSTNIPVLTGTPVEKGIYYICEGSGTKFGHSFEVGDWIISSGTSWDKVDNTDSVSSVNGKTGNITLSVEDITSSSGTLNKDLQEHTKAISANLIAQGLSGSFGFFAEGFKYAAVGDIGIDTGGNTWIYTGSGAPTKVVAAGTVPSVGLGYKQVTFNTASSINNANGGSVQDYLNAHTIASTAEAQAGTNDVKIMTSKKTLDSIKNRTYLKGEADSRFVNKSNIASVVEAQTGTDDTKIMTPLKVKSSIDFRLDQRMAEVDAELVAVKSANPYPWAMRKVDFEANRKQNNEKFAASGFVHFGKQYVSDTALPSVNEGLSASGTIAIDHLRLGRGNDYAGKSKTYYPVINVAGVVAKIEYLTTSVQGSLNEIKFPPAEDGTRTCDTSTGASVTHATSAIAFASETATNKVVTDRVDMWGFEAFLREVSDADPFVYANGLIQSLATNISGVTTISDNVRPITYFAWYEGDDSSRGKGVNWQTASEASRIKIASDPANNIYFDDETGKFYQWCIRGRSFAGRGNGDWDRADLASAKGYSYFYLGATSIATIKAQGIEDISVAYSPTALGPITYQPYDTTHSSWSNKAQPHNIGLWVLGNISTRGVNGECYFLVCGTVNRLNQGAYHPSFNPSGAAYLTDIVAGTDSVRRWSNSDAYPANSKSDCFDYKTRNRLYSGDVSGGSYRGVGPARPDGRFYDAIYASGQGGVCRDMRYSAWGLKAEDFAEADLKVKSGQYRGFENVMFSRWLKLEVSESGIRHNTAFNNVGGTQRYVKMDGDNVIAYCQTTKTTYYTDSLSSDIAVIKTTTPTWVTVQTVTEAYWLSDGESFLESPSSFHSILTSRLTLTESDSDANYKKYLDLYTLNCIPSGVSLADEYTHTEVTGDPANILQCANLKDGWVGSWNPIIPDGEIGVFELTRPYTGSVGSEYITRTHTVDDGASWISGKISISDAKTNTVIFTNKPANQVTIYQYPAKAKITEDSDFSAIYGGSIGIGDVYATSDYRISFGKSLAFSLTGNILKSNSYVTNCNMHITNSNIYVNTGALAAAPEEPQRPRHSPLLSLSWLNDSTAFKVLNYNVAKNQQGFINYAYTELRHNGTDWGDDGKISIVHNSSTMLDTNGQKVKVGTARIIEPLGWIKNDK